jgi:hypothetical protein
LLPVLNLSFFYLLFLFYLLVKTLSESFQMCPSKKLNFFFLHFCQRENKC